MSGWRQAVAKVVPSSLLGVLTGMLMEHAIIRPAGFRTRTVGDIAEISGSLPEIIWLDDSVDLPPLDGNRVVYFPFPVVSPFLLSSSS